MTYPDSISLTWTFLWTLARLKLCNPARAKRFRLKIVDFGLGGGELRDEQQP